MQLIEAEWTASSSSAANTQITAKATLSKGVYIAILQTPTMSTSLWGAFAGDSSGVLNGTYFNMTSMQTYVEIIIINSDTDDVCVETGQRTSVTYSNLTYGKLQFLKIA